MSVACATPRLRVCYTFHYGAPRVDPRAFRRSGIREVGGAQGHPGLSFELRLELIIMHGVFMDWRFP